MSRRPVAFACVGSAALVLQCGARTPVGVKHVVDAGPILAEVLDATAEDAFDPPDAAPDAALVITPMVTVIATHSCVVIADGRVKCWGENSHGELGDGTTSPALVPVSVAALGGLAASTAVGWSDTYAVLTSREVRAWGDNVAGQLGDGTFQPHASPVTVQTGTPMTSVGSWRDVFAVSATGSVLSWSHSNHTPTIVKGLESGAVAVAVGGVSFACALRADNSVWCWGSNSYGSLGDGMEHLTPSPVPGITNAIALSAGDRHVCVVLASGAMRCWGSQFFGELGNGTISEDSAPMPTDVIGIRDAVAVGAGNNITCAVVKTGGVKCWGRNNWGQLGDGTTIDRPAPVDVAGLASAAVTVSVASMHACAQLVTGHVQCWGSGTLGNGVVSEQSPPVDVVGVP
jgi:alpha-tubulin suppressor-like RCC1 family protein